MNKIFIIIIPLLLLFVSCGSKEKSMEEYVTAQNFVVYEPVSLPISKMKSKDTETTTTANEPKSIAYTQYDTEIDLIVDGQTVKTLEFTYVPDKTKIVVADFNFDGYNDIFVPFENNGSYQTFGNYYCYIPIENNFTKNSELTKIGKILTIESDNILSERQDDEYTERVIQYKWVNSKLKPFKKTETYKSWEDGQIHTNIYSYTDDGSEYLESST